MSDKIINYLQANQSVGLISDAGYPLISDPGYCVVQKAIKSNFKVIPISGPNAALNALVASGFATNHFTFFGFLDSKTTGKTKQLLSLSAITWPIIFYEAPHRLAGTLQLMAKLFPNSEIVVARELTKQYEEFWRGTIEEIVAELDQLTIKGEFVIIAQWAKPLIIAPDTSSICAEIQQAINDGMTTTDAIKHVAKKYQLDKKKVYHDFHNPK